MEEQVVECDVCGGGHETEVCPELGLGETVVEPAQSLTKARLTVPNNLIHAIVDGQNGVYAKEVLPAKTQFGPFEARRTTHEIANEDLFVLKILSKDKDGAAICLDTTDENECNWMCLVDVAESTEAQNCMAYQLGTNVFYNTTRQVEAGHALKVWYSSHYARKMGRPEAPDGLTKSMLGYVIQMAEDSVVSLPTPVAENSKVQTRIIPAQQPTMPTFNRAPVDVASIFMDVKETLWNDKDTGNENDESAMVRSDIYLYKCQRCDEAFEDQSELAYHIRNHIMPTVKKKRLAALYFCKICKVGFQTVSNYNRHMKRHVGYKVKCPECDYFTYRGDILQTHLIGQHGVTLEEAKNLACNAEIPVSPEEESEWRRTRKKKPGRKKKPIPHDDFDDDEEEEEEEDDENVEVLGEAEEEPGETIGKILKDEAPTNEEGELTADDAVVIHKEGLLSPTRVQPRRSLKGIRTTGALKGTKMITIKREKLDFFSEEEHSPVIAEIPVVVAVPSTGKKRGRPKKISVPEPPAPGDTAPKKKRGRPRKVSATGKPADKGEEDDDVQELGEIVESRFKPEPVNVESEAMHSCEVQLKPDDRKLDAPKNVAAGNDSVTDDATADITSVTGASAQLSSVTGTKMVATTGDTSKSVATMGDASVNVATMADASVNVATMADASVNVAIMAEASENVAIMAEASATVATMAEASANVATMGDASANVATMGDASANVATMGEASANVATMAEDSANVATMGDASVVDSTDGDVAVDTPAPVVSGTASHGADADAADIATTAEGMDGEDVADGKDTAEDSPVKELQEKSTEMLHLESEDSDADADYVEPIPRRRRGRPLKFGKDQAAKLLELQKQVKKVGNAFQCCECGKKFSQKKYLMLHLPKHTSKFKCDGCGKQFARHESFLNHNCIHHSVNDDVVTTDKNGCYSCGECGKIFAKPEYVKRHYSVHLSSWKCDKCIKKFSRRHLLLDHVCLAENGKEIHDNHECEICKQCFRSLKYLYRHMAMHTDIFKCKGCDKTFSRKDSLQRHVLRCSPGLADDYKIYDCKNCKKTFSTKLGLENHSLHCANYSCSKCRVAFFELEHLDKHKCDGKIAHDSASMYFPCQECGKTFASITYLRRHKESHKGAFTCSMCEKSFSRKEEQRLHEHYCYALNHLETNVEVECSNCPEKFTDAKAYRDHKHQHSHPFRCEKCCKRFIKIGTLTTHTCTEPVPEEDNPFTCTVCSRSFRSSTYLVRHQTIHEKPQFECEYCHKPFYRKDYLNNHICKLPDGSVVRIVRKRDRIFIKENLICHLCGRTFVSSSNLNKHMKIHGERQNTCPHCGKKFHYPTYLREHIKTVHQKAYQFQCADCGKILHSKTGLAAHIKQFHSNQIQLYQCGTCQKTFRQKGNLKTHMYSHTKEKTFKCDFCSKMFKYPDQLNRHRLEHTMTNKLSCEYCDKKFCRQYQLKKHLQTFHSGVVYVCDICNERCSHKHTIVRHYKRKHPEVSSVFDDQPDYLSNLQRDHADADVQLDIKPSITSIVEAIDQVETTVITTESANGEQQIYTVAEIQTEVEEYLPHVAAEALQNLSNSIIATEGGAGTLAIPSSMESADGQQTVVILQIVNTEDEEAMQEIQTIQEVQEIMYTEEES